MIRAVVTKRVENKKNNTNQMQKLLFVCMSESHPFLQDKNKKLWKKDVSVLCHRWKIVFKSCKSKTGNEKVVQKHAMISETCIIQCLFCLGFICILAPVRLCTSFQRTNAPYLERPNLCSHMSNVCIV